MRPLLVPAAIFFLIKDGVSLKAQVVGARGQHQSKAIESGNGR